MISDLRRNRVADHDVELGRLQVESNTTFANLFTDVLQNCGKFA